MLSFDIVIPTKNRPDDLGRLLVSINSQTELPKNVIIVDQSDIFNKPKGSYKFPINHLHKNSLSGLTAAKNEGIKHSKSEIIYFFDDDIILYNDFFETINQQFESYPDIFGICGRQVNSKSSRFKLAMFNIFHTGCFKDIRKKCNSGFEKVALKSTNILPGGVTGYRQSIFQEFLFDEKFIKYCLGEDMDFSYRVSSKYKLAFSTKALAIHNHSTIGRYNPYDSFSCKVAGYAYFFKKNVSPKLSNILSFYWVETGVLLDALQYSILKFNLDSIKGFFKGIEMVKSGFKNVPFLSI